MTATDSNSAPVVGGILTGIHIHPVKSCRAVELDRVEMTRRGLAGDRLFQVVDGDARPVTQRQEPRLATIRPTQVDGGLRLDADGHSAIEVATPRANDTTASSLLGTPVAAGDAGDDAAAWFSDVLGAPVRLVAITDDSEHVVPFPGAEMHIGWADGASVLIANSASLDWLNERTTESFGMDRFRPNLTVDAAPWAEDTWRDVSIGAARLGVGLAWPRCAIPQIDQIDGTRHREPAKVLKAYRWCSHAPSVPAALRPVLEGNALFGLACSVDNTNEPGATVAVGDEVIVHRTGPRIIDAPHD